MFPYKSLILNKKLYLCSSDNAKGRNQNQPLHCSVQPVL